MMDIGETIRKAIQDFILPELEVIKAENKEIRTALELTNKRLDDINIHLVDQSRRIDEVRAELTKRIDETNKRIDSVHRDMVMRIDKTNQKIDKTNDRIDRLYEVIVRRDEFDKFEMKMMRIERDIAEMKEEIQKVAA
ncbi:MAG: hypothetical protein AAB267_00770 [Candidatus Desantisbacteria bacterium]